MNKSPRQVQRILTQLEKAGHITRIERFLGYKAQTSNAYALDGWSKARRPGTGISKGGRAEQNSAPEGGGRNRCLTIPT